MDYGEYRPEDAGGETLIDLRELEGEIQNQRNLIKWMRSDRGKNHEKDLANSEKKLARLIKRRDSILKNRKVFK